MIKKLIKLTLGIAFVAAFASCDKADVLALYSKAAANTLSSSLTVVAPPPTDADNEVVSFSWTDPKLGTDSNNYKFVLEFDTAASFSNPVKTVVTGNKFSKAFIGSEINAMLLAWNFPFGVARNVSVRLSSSYANNNDFSYSTPIVVSMAPYKIPPKIELPSTGELYIVGGFGADGAPYWWNNSPSNAPRSKFAQLDETTFVGVFEFSAAQSYLVLPVNNSNWDNKYGTTGGNNSNDPVGGDFKPQGGDMLAPATAGSYKVAFDFQFGKFTVAPSDIAEINEMYIVGDATPAGWDFNSPAAQKLTKLNAAEFEITVAMEPGKYYKFNIKNPAGSDIYHPQMGSSSSTGGDLVYNATADSPTMGSPAVAGTYKIHVNTYTAKYTITKL